MVCLKTSHGQKLKAHSEVLFFCSVYMIAKDIEVAQGYIPVDSYFCVQIPRWECSFQLMLSDLHLWHSGKKSQALTSRMGSCSAFCSGFHLHCRTGHNAQGCCWAYWQGCAVSRGCSARPTNQNMMLCSRLKAPSQRKGFLLDMAGS